MPSMISTVRDPWQSSGPREAEVGAVVDGLVEAISHLSLEFPVFAVSCRARPCGYKACGGTRAVVEFHEENPSEELRKYSPKTV